MNKVLSTIFNSPNHEYTLIETKITESQSLIWNKDLGIGVLPSIKTDDEVYSQSYWDNYRKLIDTEIGKNLTQARIDIADKFKIVPNRLVDIGIGNGQFCDTFGCRGYDVNKVAVDYLKKTKKYTDIYQDEFVWEWFSFWDVIEHVYDADELLKRTNNIILSTPIYLNMEECLASKHFKINEHVLYFTVSGMIHYMSMYGFKCKYYSTVETKCGRESIGSFVFTRN